MRLRDELLEEMQAVVQQAKQRTENLVAEARSVSNEEVKLLKFQLEQKTKQVDLLQEMVNDMESSSRLTSDVQEISGSTTQRERPFVDDFLLKVLGERDELTDQLHDLHNELAETKAHLGTAQLEKERLLVEMRTMAARLQAETASSPNSTTSSAHSSPARPEKPKRSRGSQRGGSSGSLRISTSADETIRQLNHKIFRLEEELAEHQRQGSRLKRKETFRLREAERLKSEVMWSACVPYIGARVCVVCCVG